MIKSATDLAHRQQKHQQEEAVQRKAQEEANFPCLTATGFQDLLVRLLIRRDLPFTFATSQELHDLVYAIWPAAASLLLSSPNTIKSFVFLRFSSQKSRLKELLHLSVSNIHFTMDLWTSPNHIAFLGVIAHFTTPTYIK
jgi:hypothetical protein